MRPVWPRMWAAIEPSGYERRYVFWRLIPGKSRWRSARYWEMPGSTLLGQDHRLEGLVVAAVDVLDELARGDADHLRQAVEDRHPARALQLARLRDQVLADRVLDQGGAVAVDDVAARGLGDDGAQPVALGPLGVLLAGDDLEEPQPHQQDPEQRHGDAAEDRDAHGDPGGERRRPSPSPAAAEAAGRASWPERRGHDDIRAQGSTTRGAPRRRRPTSRTGGLRRAVRATVGSSSWATNSDAGMLLPSRSWNTA